MWLRARRHAARDRALGKTKELSVDLVGVDLNPKSASVAEAATPSDLQIQYRTGDYHDLGGFDFIISNLVRTT
jgi:hypothetical protein